MSTYVLDISIPFGDDVERAMAVSKAIAQDLGEPNESGAGLGMRNMTYVYYTKEKADAALKHLMRFFNDLDMEVDNNDQTKVAVAIDE